jgi:hypothetical protein
MADAVGHVVHHRLHLRQPVAVVIPGSHRMNSQPTDMLAFAAWAHTPTKRSSPGPQGADHVQQRRPVALRHVQLQPGVALGGQSHSSAPAVLSADIYLQRPRSTWKKPDTQARLSGW